MTNNQVHSRILVIDDEERVREDLCAMFQPLGYDVQVATGSGNTLLNNAKSQARKFRPHVAIVDLRLLMNDDPNDRSGVKLVEELGPARCILYSAYISHEISRQLADFKAAGWIGKEEHPQRLVDLVNKIARESSASRKGFRIEKNSVSFDQVSHTIFGKDPEVPPSLIEDILCQTFSDDSGVNIETITGAVKTPMSVNRGHSVVLKVKRKYRIQPLVVKLASAKDISREYQNYKQYIDENLKGSFSAIPKGEPRCFWDLGAVVYNFLGSSDQKNMSEFSVFYQREQDSSVILKPLQAFFGEAWHGLYDPGEKKEITTSLYSSYEKTLQLQKRLTNFLDQREYRSFRGIDTDLLNPVPWVLKHKMDSAMLNARQAVTHGDLHGDNVFVDGDHAWVIDFERSGWGHILRDFAELEVDIVTRLAWKKDDKDLKEFFRLAVYLAEPYYLRKNYDPAEQFKNPELRKAFNVIRGLRQLAYDTTIFNDFREYIWSLLFDSVFVAALPTEENYQNERALLYGSVLCNCLQHWGEAWPPEEWKSILASTQAPAEIIPVKIALPTSKENNANLQEPSLQVAESQTKKLSPQIINIIGTSAFFAVGMILIMALLWVMSLLHSTWQQILAVVIFIILFAIIAFALLGLVKGPDALNAIMKMFSGLFNKEMKSSDKNPHPGDAGNDKSEG